MHRMINTIHRGAVIVTIAGLAALGLAQTAGAATIAAPTTLAASAQTEDPITSKSRSDCTDYLETWGYEVTKKRYLICGLASFPFPSQQVRIATCTAALLATGVGGVVAPISCILATAP
ncbi:hypothetical protein ABZ345_32550 [Lentzea sp. NPDC005914]|uniref:hypothetical protein n=1 Tax=Lentzea sp. NPDC005914 TaxID=3154572 RepID=UPI0033E1B564